MRFARLLGIFAAIASSAGCSAASNGSGVDGADYAPLFGPPSSAKRTPGALLGLWSGEIDSADLRMKLEPSKLTVAVRCSGATAGVTIAAEVSATAIRTLESGSAKAGHCTVRVRPMDVKGCASANDVECFAIYDETKLRLRMDVFTLEQDVPAERGQGPSPGAISFTKLSD